MSNTPNPVYEKLMKCYESFRSQIDFQPEVALILGSGLGDFANDIRVTATLDYHDIEGFPVSTVPNEYNAFRSNMKINAKITDWLEVGANVNFQDRSDGDIQVSLGSNYWDNNMLRNSPYASMYDNNGNYEQYPMSGLPTNGGYNYYFDRQYYDLEKGCFNAFSTIASSL